MLLAMCLTSVGTYAQDDDVYFVPSSKDKVERTDSYTAGRSSYTNISSADSETFQSDSWADHRGNGKWDVDAYNRRGRNYRGQNAADSTRAREAASLSYDDGYDDGYEDGYYTSRLVRFWSPRVGVYVSSPFYLDYYDLCYYDPFYYGYASPWYGWGWSGWFGWGSWYGWRPYYSSWYGWGWGGWYDPWYDPWYGGPGWGWGGWHGGWTAWRPSHIDGGNWHVGNSHRPFINANNRTSASNGFGGRGSNFGFSNNRPAQRGTFNGANNRTSVNGSTSRTPRTYGNFDTNSRSNRSNRNNSYTPDRNSSTQTSRPSRSYNSTPSYSTPSRGSFGGGFSGGGNFGGGSRGGGRSFGGRR